MKEKFFPLRIALYVCVSLLVLTTICALDDAFHILDCITHTLSILFADICPNIQLMIPDNYSSFDILLSQISNTFIVLSLTAVLSTNVGYVYWIDIKDHKLVEPLFSCFIAIMTYLLTDLCFSVIVYLLNKPDSLFLSFLVSIILLIWLSYKMISVYFGRNRMKQKLLLTYLQDKWTVDLAVLCKNNSSSTEAYRDNLRRVYPTGEILPKFDRFCTRWFKLLDTKKEKLAAQSKEKLLTYENAIYENTIRALSENNKQIMDENIRLIAPMDRKKTVLRLLSEIDTQNPCYAADLLYSLYTTGNYSPNTEDLTIYAQTLTERLLHEKTDSESLFHMAMLLGSLNDGNNFMEELNTLCKEAAQYNDDELEKQIRSRIIPLYSQHFNPGCYKFIDKLYHAYVQKDSITFHYYLNLIEWIRSKLEQTINTTSSALRTKTSAFQLAIRTVDFLDENEAALINKMLSDKSCDTFLTELDKKLLTEKIVFMNIYILVNVEPSSENSTESIAEKQNNYEILKSVLGERNPATQKAKTRLAIAYNSCNDYVSTLKLLGSDNGTANLSTENDTEALLASVIKAYALIQSGYQRKALSIVEEIYEKLNLSTMDVTADAESLLLKNISDVFFFAKNYEICYKIDKHIYDILIQKDPNKEEEPTLDAFFRYVTTCSSRNSFLAGLSSAEQPSDFVSKEAEILLLKQEAYEKYRDKLGEEHPKTLKARGNWFISRKKHLSREETLVEYNAIYELRQKVLGTNHPSTLYILSARCDFLSSQDTYDNSSILSDRKQIYQGYLNRLGDKHPNTLLALLDLSLEYEKQGNQKSSDELLETLTESLQQLADRNNHTILSVMRKTANIYKERADYETALNLYQEIYFKQMDLKGEDDRDTIDILNHISEIYTALGRKDEVIKCNIDIYQKYISTYFKLYRTARNNGKYGDAARYRNLSALYRVKKYTVENNISSEKGHQVIQDFFQKRIDPEAPLNSELLRDYIDFGIYFLCEEKLFEAEKYLRKAYQYCQSMPEQEEEELQFLRSRLEYIDEQETDTFSDEEIDALFQQLEESLASEE